MNEFDPIDPNEEVSIINPTANDFTLDVVVPYKKGQTITYTVKARESLKLPRYAAQHVSERLAQQIEGRKSGVITDEYHRLLLKQVRMYAYEDKP